MSGAAGCRHELLLHESDADLVAAVQPFVSAGISAGDMVVVGGSAADVELLRGVFDDDPRVCFEPATDRFRGLMPTLARYQRMCERENAAGRAVRVTGGAPVSMDATARREWMSYEALVGRALAPYRFSGLCRYDTRTAPADLVRAAVDTHEHAVTARGRQLLPAALPGHGGAAPLQDLAVDVLELAPIVVDQPACTAASGARWAVRRALRAGGIEGAEADAFVSAVSEVVSNAFAHGRPPVGLRLHTDGRGWLCLVTDRGPGIGDPWTGVDSPLPGNPAPVGAGLWLARQLCSRLTISHRDGGSQVSVYSRL